MAGEYILCTDGSDLANQAIARGLACLKEGPRRVVVTVVENPDPTLMTGAGLAGGTMSPAAFEELEQRLLADGEEAVREAAAQLHLDDADTKVLRGHPGTRLCEYAAEIDAGAIVIGTRGRGGLKRALLGSVSDYVVRHAPCPVVVSGAVEADG